VDLESMRFILPTICDRIAAELPTRSWTAKPHRVYLDDRRQIELVDRELEATVKKRDRGDPSRDRSSRRNAWFARVHVRVERSDVSARDAAALPSLSL
jgi:hypothetical protein